MSNDQAPRRRPRSGAAAGAASRRLPFDDVLAALSFHFLPELLVRDAAPRFDLAAGPAKKLLELGGVCQHQPLQFVIVHYRKQHGDRLAVPRAWASIKTGVLTIEPATLLTQGETYLANSFAGNRFNGLAPADALKNFCFDTMTAGTQMIGRKPQGVLLAVPITIRGMDSESQAVTLRYYVFAEVPYAKLADRLKKMAETAAAATVSAPAGGGVSPPAAGSPEDLKTEVVNLRRKVETLEARLDLVTRELSALRRDMTKPDDGSQ